MPHCGKTGEFIMSIMEQITEILVETFSLDAEEVTAEARLEADLGINSLELAELALRCDEEFGVEIDDEDIHRLITVGDVANYIEEKTA
jgi:acyl carrier protein